VHLSGGIDSSLIAAFAVRTLKQRGLPAPTGYSWQQAKPEAARDSEPGWAEVIREELGLELRSPRLTPRELADLLLVDWTASHDVRNLLHEAAIQRDAGNDRVEVILSGWGGDEGLSFHGRGLDPELLVTGRWLTLFREGQPPGLYGGVRAFYGAARRLWIDLKPRKSLRRLIDRGKSLIAPDFARQTQLLPVHRFREFGVRATQIALLRDGATANRIENWAISGARHGIVYGYPLLDRRLLEYLFSLPPRMFKRRGQDRWLAREVAKGLVPDLIRCNSRKDEPERVEQMSGDLAEAYRLIAPLLDDPNTPLARARYVDMPRLREQLSEAIETGSTQSRGLRAALQFLDLK
jgi:asparagine synthase (glutamine-hydrolysing)